MLPLNLLSVRRRVKQCMRDVYLVAALAIALSRVSVALKPAIGLRIALTAAGSLLTVMQRLPARIRLSHRSIYSISDGRS